MAGQLSVTTVSLLEQQARSSRHQYTHDRRGAAEQSPRRTRGSLAAGQRAARGTNGDPSPQLALHRRLSVRIRRRHRQSLPRSGGRGQPQATCRDVVSESVSRWAELPYVALQRRHPTRTLASRPPHGSARDRPRSESRTTHILSGTQGLRARTASTRNRTPWLSDGLSQSIRTKTRSASSNRRRRQQQSPNP